MVEIGGLQDQDHEVLGSQYCSGYTDSFGKWNTGFYCPTLGERTVYCCGTANRKYCCTQRDEDRIAAPLIDQTTLLGIVLGCVILVVLVTLASCVLCRKCVMRRKRQHAAINGGPLYQMHCSSSSGSGVANAYAMGVSTENGSPIEMNGQPHSVDNHRGEYVVDDSFAAITPFPNNHQQLSRVMRNGHLNCPLNHSEPPPPYRETRSTCSLDRGGPCPSSLAMRPSNFINNTSALPETSDLNRSVLTSFRTSSRNGQRLESGRVVSSALRGQNGGDQRITHI